MLLFNPIATQTRVCHSGERHDLGASYYPPPIKVDATLMGCPLHLKMNPPIENEPPIH